MFPSQKWDIGGNADGPADGFNGAGMFPSQKCRSSTRLGGGNYASAQRRRDEEQAQSSCHDGVVVEWVGKPESQHAPTNGGMAAWKAAPRSGLLERNARTSSSCARMHKAEPSSKIDAGPATAPSEAVKECARKRALAS